MENIDDLEQEKVLEKRMYFFTIFQLSGRQIGIQAGHAGLRYARLFADKDPEVWDFVDNHETWIILNGGTTNAERDFDGKSLGSLNQIADQLLDNDIRFSYFIEPTLNNALTAVCFLLDERVFNYKDYPDFSEYITNDLTHLDEIKECRLKNNIDLISEYPREYKSWVRLIGGVKNVFLRELIKGKKLA